MKKQINDKGITLLELCLALFIGSIVVVGVYSLHHQSVNQYMRQESNNVMHSNTSKIINFVTDALIQAGADLPQDENVIVVDSNNLKTVTILVNPTGAYHSFTNTTSLKARVKVTDASPFVGRSQIWFRRAVPVGFSTLTIDKNLTSGNFVNGVDTLNDSIAFTSSQSFNIGDAIYIKQTEKITHSHASKKLTIEIDSILSVLSDNVDTFNICFYSLDKQPQYSWKNMKVCSLYVVIKSAGIEKNCTDCADQYKRIRYSKLFYLRNKV